MSKPVSYREHQRREPKLGRPVREEDGEHTRQAASFRLSLTRWLYEERQSGREEELCQYTEHTPTRSSRPKTNGERNRPWGCFGCASLVSIQTRPPGRLASYTLSRRKDACARQRRPR